MVEKDRNGLDRMAAIVFSALALAVILMEILVIAGLLPYDIIGAGRYASRDDATAPALLSIFILTAQSGIVLASCRQKRRRGIRIVLRILLFLILAGLCLNIAGNLFAVTMFEKAGRTGVCAVQALCVIRLLMKRKTTH